MDIYLPPFETIINAQMYTRCLQPMTGEGVIQILCPGRKRSFSINEMLEDVRREAAEVVRVGYDRYGHVDQLSRAGQALWRLGPVNLNLIEENSPIFRDVFSEAFKSYTCFPDEPYRSADCLSLRMGRLSTSVTDRIIYDSQPERATELECLLWEETNIGSLFGHTWFVLVGRNNAGNIPMNYELFHPCDICYAYGDTDEFECIPAKVTTIEEIHEVVRIIQPHICKREVLDYLPERPSPDRQLSSDIIKACNRVYQATLRKNN